MKNERRRFLLLVLLFLFLLARILQRFLDDSLAALPEALLERNKTA
jgi:hypothetical protein